jgi:SAM-dependent methyltransferase
VKPRVSIDSSEAPAANPAPPLGAQLIELIWGYQRSQIVYAAARLGLADLLADEPQSIEELATATGTDAASLYRLLRTLAGHGLFAERDDARFEQTGLSELLRTGTAGSLRAMALAEGEDFYPVWGHLVSSVQTGEPAFERVFGMSNWEYREHHPEANGRFNAYMSDLTRQKAAAVVANYPFPDRGVVIDVGGGDGTLLAAILQAYPDLRGVLFDLPHVAEEAGRTLRAAGVAERCDVVGGDFFVAVPRGGDCYLLATVLHDWDDERSAEILRQCRQSLAQGGRVLLIERVMPLGNTPSPAKLRDLHMLVTNAGGRERTEAEWETLLATGGFQLRTVTPAGPVYHLLEALPT